MTSSIPDREGSFACDIHLIRKPKEAAPWLR